MLVTTAARVSSIPELPVVEGVRYIISVQDHEATLSPDNLKALYRSDVQLRIYYDRGLSVNRNHALEASSADIVMVADDDLIFHPEGLRDLIKLYEQNPDIDWITTRAGLSEGRIYPPDGWDLQRVFRHYVPVSFELSFRRTSLPVGFRFSPLAGIGAPYLGAGEDDLVYFHARRAGLRGVYKHIKVVTHPSATTNVRSASQIPVVRAKGALLRIMRGVFPGLIRIPVEAYRSPLPFGKAFVALTQGYIYASTHKDQL